MLSRYRPPVVVYLLAVVVVPLVALGVVIGVQLQRIDVGSRGARALSDEVAAADAWVGVLTAIQTERFFVQGSSTATELGIPLELVRAATGLDLAAGASTGRTRTDAGLRRIGDETATEVAGALELAREAGAPLATVNGRFDQSEDTVLREVTRRMASIRRLGDSIDNSALLQESIAALLNMERYRTLSLRQMDSYFRASITTDAAEAQQQRRSLASITDAFAEVHNAVSITSPSWVGRTAAIEQHAASRAFALSVERLLAEPIETTGLSAPRIEGLVTDFEAADENQRMIAGAFQDAAADVTSHARDLVGNADRARARWLFAAGALVVASFLAAGLVTRSIRRPLQRLEAAAQQVSRGELTVPVRVNTGPREVATVGRALTDAVANLRALSDRVAQLAKGDTNSDALPHVDGGMQGPLSNAIEATVNRLAEAMGEQAHLRAQLAHDATHDALTGLPNRAGLLTALNDAVEGASTDKVVGVLFIDVDGLKQVNDLFGHSYGDDVIKEVAQRLTRSTRPSDTVGRLGGDEFVVLIQNSTTDEVRSLGERITTDLARLYTVGGVTMSLSASVGLSFADGSAEAEGVLAEADLALYRAKSLGKGQLQAFESTMRSQLEQRHDFELGLRRALANDELSLHYQPIVSLPDSKLVGLEALLRWCHPERGLISPALFIPVVERSALITEVGDFVLRSAVRQLAEWQNDAALRHLSISVNMSARQMLDRDLVRSVSDALTEHGVNPALLVIEMTETAAFAEIGLVTRQVQALGELGVRVAIDDFGTGYASLGQLAALPVHSIKIDKSFVAKLAVPKELALTRLMVETGRALKLDVIAEGVERQWQLDQLIEIGCPMAQGYLFAEPAPADVALARMRRPRTSPHAS